MINSGADRRSIEPVVRIDGGSIPTGWMGRVAFLSCVGVVAILSEPCLAQTTARDLNAIYSVQDWPIKTLREGKVYLIPGGGSNSTVIIGDQGVIVIDVKTTMATGQELLKKIATLTSKPVTHVIQTHSDCDHVSGIVAFPKSVKIIAHVNNRTEQVQVARLATVEINGGYGVTPQDRLPNVLITKNKEAATIDGVRLVFHHAAAGHTGGDMMIYLPDEKVMVTGDIFAFTSKTKNGLIFKFEKDASIAGWFENADAALKTDAEIFVTGHGDELLTKPDLQRAIADFRAQMAKVDALAASGKSLEETIKEMGDPPFDPLANQLLPTTMKECPRGTTAVSPSWIRWHEWTNQNKGLKAMNAEK